jgi:hypothetical protein
MKPIFTGAPRRATVMLLPLEPEPVDAGVFELDEHAATNEDSVATMSAVTKSALKRIRGKTPPRVAGNVAGFNRSGLSYDLALVGSMGPGQTAEHQPGTLIT